MNVGKQKSYWEFKDVLFFLALCIYFFRRMIGLSLYSNILPQMLFRIMYILIISLLAIRLLIFEQFHSVKLISWCVVLLCTFAVLYKGSYFNLLLVVMLILSSQDVSFESILKCTVINLTVYTILVVVSCRCGILQDYTYVHNSIGETNNIAHSLGYQYYSTLGYVTMTLSSCYLFINKRCSFIKLFIIVVINYILFRIHTTNLSFIIVLLMVAAYVLVYKFNLFKFKSRIWGFFCTVFPSVMCLLTITIVKLFEQRKITVVLTNLNTIRGRLQYSVRALNEYGIHMFGTKVIMYGNTALFYGGAKSGFYIDSAYIYNLIAYGVFFTILVTIMYSIVYRYIFSIEDKWLFIWMGMILAMSSINNFLLAPEYNPLIFLFGNAFISIGNKPAKDKG